MLIMLAHLRRGISRGISPGERNCVSEFAREHPLLVVDEVEHCISLFLAQRQFKKWAIGVPVRATFVRRV